MRVEGLLLCVRRLLLPGRAFLARDCVVVEVGWLFFARVGVRARLGVVEHLGRLSEVMCALWLMLRHLQVVT